MKLNIALITPARRFISNRVGLGYQVPLGLVLLGGPLIDSGHNVRLIDNDLYGLSDKKLVQRLQIQPPDCIMIGHSGSTAAHPVAMRTAAALRLAFPSAIIIYGGVYPSFTAVDILKKNQCIDIIVHGEGEETVTELAEAISIGIGSFDHIGGITFRGNDAVVTTQPREPIEDLDRFRPGWELVDWEEYTLLGFGRSAGIQFSRGCTLKCSYCGQWSFWKKYRHHSPEFIAEQMEQLVNHYGVRFIWFADENFAADREATKKLLRLIIEKDLGLALNANMTATLVVRDKDILWLYKKAGFVNVIMGVESMDDKTIERIQKDNPFELSCQATRLLRSHGVVGFANIIFGLEDENPASLWRTFKNLLKLDQDVFSIAFITPHHWTVMGSELEAAHVVQPDQHYWTYRNQVITTPKLRPWQLFTLLKIIEAAFHLRPRALWRMAFGTDRLYRKVLRAYLALGFRVVVAELHEFIFKTRFVKPGTIDKRPGFPEKSPIKQK